MATTVTTSILLDAVVMLIQAQVAMPGMAGAYRGSSQREGADLHADQYRTEDLFLVAVHLWLDSSDDSRAHKIALLIILHLDASAIQITLSALGA